MKKILTVLFVLFIVSNFSFAYQSYWDGISTSVFKVKDMMRKMPEASNAYVSINKQLITDGKLDCSVSMNLTWHNFFTRGPFFSDICGFWTVVEINYERRVYYALATSNSYTELQSLRVKDGKFDVRSVSMRPSDDVDYGTRMQECSTEFRDFIESDISNLTPNKEYKLKVEYFFTVVPEADICGSNYDATETTRYVTKQTVSIGNMNTGADAKFKLYSSVVNSVINANSLFNPIYNTGSGDRYLIYDNPDAVIAVVADKLNLPSKVEVESGTNVSCKYGAGAYIASIGSSSLPTEIDTYIPTTGGCGIYVKDCSKNCNGLSNVNVQFVNDNVLQKSFLLSKGGLQRNVCYKRWTNIMQRSIDEGMSVYDENTLEHFDIYDSNDYRMSRMFHLRDLSNVDVYTKKGYGAGTTIKIQNSALYNGSFQNSMREDLADFYALGYMYYGPSIDKEIATGKGTVSNILVFEVVNEAKLPAVSTSDKLPKMTCITDSLVKEGDFIHLKGSAIQCGNYSETIYNPDYIWEVSFNGADWETLDKKSFSKYIIDRNSLGFAVVVDPDRDILVKSTILKNRSQAQFRQKVILRSFASDEFSPLYNYRIDDKYYISIVSGDFYTYIPTPILDQDNIAFTPSTFPLEQRLCKGDVLTKNKISFKLKSSTNVSADKIGKLSEIADYKIYELHGDTVGKLVSNAASYTINYSGKTIGFRCVISWCNDSIYKDVHIIANDDESIELKDIYSNVVIVERNETENKLKLLCQRGVVPTISLFEKVNNEFDYQYRGVSPYSNPIITVNDFSSMSRTKIISFMKSANWDYEAETGTDVDNTGIDALRAWCRVKEDKTNAMIVSNAKNNYVSANAWYGFTDNNITELPVSNATASDMSFYVMKQNVKTKCYSDSVKIEIVFFDGIEDNKIAFSAASDASKSEVYVMENTNSPAIKGYVIKGGYGVPSKENSFKYVYRYIYRESGGVWQQLGSDIEVYGDNNKNVSLKAGALAMDRLYQVARVVYSRVGNDILTQVTDTSNILTINVIEELKTDDIEIYNNGSCAGVVVTLGVPNYDPSKKIKDATRFIWSASDTAVKIISYDEMERYCSLYNTRSDFNVYVYRTDTITGARTKTVEIPIDVVEVKPKFSITADGVTRNIMDYPNENFYFQSGTRFVLNNSSEGADSYLWNLELQYYSGSEIEGLTSYVENPVCYLYNPGQNRIRLTAMNSLGCESQITAENIYIQSSSVKNATVNSHFERSGVTPQFPNEFTSGYEVYPTVTTGDDINIYYSKGLFRYTLMDSMGRIILEGVSDMFRKIDYENLSDGVSTLVLEAGDNGNSNNKIIRLIKQ